MFPKDFVEYFHWVFLFCHVLATLRFRQCYSIRCRFRSYSHFVLISFMVFRWGSSVRHVALRVWVVAAIMLSAIEMERI